ncbi:GATA zinc finger domain-containing protein 14-like [Hetaerina americana]|uniref:GATA zinc finger domain-containing protein 14-like n=1 Tax=Hetaerina americana TaxID=62018 RepID=UPI003A7F381B
MSYTKILVTLAVLFLGQVSAQRRPPNYSLDDMPETSFDCSDKIVGGYYADPEADCQMFHVCVRMPGNDVQDYRFLCPNDTMFDQENRICANWFDIDCEAAAVYYGNSFDLYRIGSSGNVDQRLTEIVASPSPIIALGPSTTRAPLANKPRTAGSGYYANRRAGPRNNFETNNAAEEEALIRSATGDRRLQNANSPADLEAEQESYDDTPKRRNNPKKALRKFSRTRGGKDEAYSGSSTKDENAYSSSSRVYFSSTTPVPTPEATTAASYRNNYNNYRGSSNYDGFQRNGGNNRNSFVSTTSAAPETTANTRKFSNDYRGSSQPQQPVNYNFQQQRDYKVPSTISAATTFGSSPSTTPSPSQPSFSGNFQNYQKPPSRPSVASTAAPQNTNSFGSNDRSPLPTTFSPNSGQNNYNNYNFNRNGNKNYDSANPAPTTYSPPTSKANNYNSFASNNYNNNGNLAPTTYSPATSKSTNYNPYTANFNNNYNAQTSTTLAPQTGSDFTSFRTSNFQRNNYNAFPSTTAAPNSFPSTAFAPTSRRQPFNNRRTFQSPQPYQASADDEKESLNTAQSANFGSSDEYQSSNAFRRFNNKAQVNQTKTYFSSTQAPASYQTIDRGSNRAQGVNTETTVAFTTRSPYRFPQNDRTNSGFSASTAAAPTTRGNNNYQSGNTYSNPIPSNSGTQAGSSTRANNGFVNRAPVTTARPQGAANNQPQIPQGQNEQQKGGEAYDYAYYDDGENFDYDGFAAEAENHFGKTDKASKVTPSVPRN